ncbi:MAG TPA: HAD-IA family hydrolase [Pseudonocardiaceae bacterium]|nr:HAD-IA family hydrolase [Pseudonocardiaceae bacterium]
MAELRWATFDCFGTLVDWRHGIATGAELLFPGRGADLLDVYNRHEPLVQQENPTMRYRDVLAETLRRATEDAGLTMIDDDASVLATGMPYWPVFSDTRAALAQLRAAGWRLALLTNCDRDIIGATQRRLGVPIDAIVTAEDAGAYKPSHAHFTRFADAFGVSTDQWVHVAQSYFHDMRPAHELGIPRVWINRLGEPDDPSIVDAELPGLTGLAATVDRVHSTAR